MVLILIGIYDVEMIAIVNQVVAKESFKDILRQDKKDLLDLPI